MVSYNTDEEQIEALKNWWNENGTQLLVGLVIVLTGVFGYQTWQNNMREEGEAASALYEELRVALSASASATGEERAHQITTASYISDTLKEEHESSAYSKFAAMQMAKLAVEQGNLNKAELDLEWVMDHGSDAIIPLARLRLARVLFAKGDRERALALVENVEEGAYRSSYAEVRGDFYHRLGRNKDARQAYQAALNEMQGTGSNPLIQMKMDDIAVPTAPAGTASDAEDPVVQQSPEQPQPAVDQPET